MGILLLKVVLGTFTALLIGHLILALKNGSVRWGEERLGISAQRAQEPKTFWMLWIINAGSALFLLWLIFSPWR